MLAREHPASAADPAGVETWWPRAACKGSDQSIFFADDDESIAAAKAVCALCPVREQCLEFSLQGHHYGIWGGLTEERTRLRRSRRRRTAEEVERTVPQ
jgi:WhiB family redox-sensing transcriptional regulator